MDRLNDELSLEIATRSDSDLLLKLRNDPETRRMSHNQGLISKDDHDKWFASNFNQSHCKIYLTKWNKIKTGSIRANLIDNNWFLTWSLLPEYRGKGFLKHYLKLFLVKFNQRVFADVKRNNIASMKSAEFAGMTKYKEEAEFLTFKYEPK